ncbi:ran-binding protein [Sporothrix brasiliensis 5110]|uniref:Ran-binding protein n=1 Tax=Sporothrix brasiliensis 5110 TaxID=1398154 RepID=A0A0C2FBU5_9PEZI|nr:ran-binding protein [Sporothrix brasiliensis 5110]KIH88548.1 ran-binding protein [Sporothrix brasiliensis 5110]
MSNPYSYPDSGLPTGLPGFSPRRPSYASAAGSPGGYGRSGATFQQLLNTTNADGSESNGANFHTSIRPPYGSHSSSSANLTGSNDDDADPMWSGLNTNVPDSALMRLLGSRGQLPSFSRAFEPFLRGPSYTDAPGTTIVPNNNAGFFTPSYLRESVYVQRLEEQYKAKVQAARESQQLHARQPAAAQPGAGASSSGGMMLGAGNLGGLHGRHSSSLLGGGGSGGLDGLSTYASLTSISINNGPGGLGNGKIGGPGSHRGLAFDVVEKGLGGGSGSGIGIGGSSGSGGGGGGGGLADDEEPMAPLPSRWDKDDKASSLDVLSDGLDVKFAGSRSASDHNQHAQEAGSVRADHYMPPQCGIYYYEVTILSKKREESTIGIGFSEASAKLSRPPGWEPGSWGYHSDDGNVFTDHGSGKKYGPSFGPGDIVGCGVNFRTGTAFFTKNGEDLGVAFKDIKSSSLKLFPSVGMKKLGEHIRVNFGQVPFTFDIDGVMKVLQFLQQDGYVDTARAFAKEIEAEKEALNIDSKHPVRGYNIADDEDANKRQRIRRAVLEGDIDRALELTKADYPTVLHQNETVHFHLKCRKFVEMIRKEAELNIVGSGHGSSNANGSTNGADPSQAGGDAARQANGHNPQMDVDDVMMVEDSGTAESQPADQPVSQALVQNAVRYGQYLQIEFNSDMRPKIQNALNEIFSLLAYPNPLKQPEVAHLLDQRGRVAVAEELNSAILLSTGKSSRSALENLHAQTNVLLEDLRQNGGPGSFVTIQGVLDGIPQPYTP